MNKEFLQDILYTIITAAIPVITVYLNKNSIGLSNDNNKLILISCLYINIILVICQYQLFSFKKIFYISNKICIFKHKVYFIAYRNHSC